MFKYQLSKSSTFADALQLIGIYLKWNVILIWLFPVFNPNGCGLEGFNAALCAWICIWIMLRQGFFFLIRPNFATGTHEAAMNWWSSLLHFFRLHWRESLHLSLRYLLSWMPVPDLCSLQVLLTVHWTKQFSSLFFPFIV